MATENMATRTSNREILLVISRVALPVLNSEKLELSIDDYTKGDGLEVV